MTTKKTYQSPEIVEMGLAVELTNGMGGSSHDMGGMTIPVTVPNEELEDLELDIPDAF